MKYTPLILPIMEKVVKEKVVKEKVVDLEQFEGELEFECTGKSKHLNAGLKVNLHFDLAKVFKRLGYIK